MLLANVLCLSHLLTCQYLVARVTYPWHPLSLHSRLLLRNLLPASPWQIALTEWPSYGPWPYSTRASAFNHAHPTCVAPMRVPQLLTIPEGEGCGPNFVGLAMRGGRSPLSRDGSLLLPLAHWWAAMSLTNETLTTAVHKLRGGV